MSWHIWSCYWQYFHQLFFSLMYLLSMVFGKNDLLKTQLVTNYDSKMTVLLSFKIFYQRGNIINTIYFKKHYLGAWKLIFSKCLQQFTNSYFLISWFIMCGCSHRKLYCSIISFLILAMDCLVSFFILRIELDFNIQQSIFVLNKHKHDIKIWCVVETDKDIKTSLLKMF